MFIYRLYTQNYTQKILLNIFVLELYLYGTVLLSVHHEYLDIYLLQMK